MSVVKKTIDLSFKKKWIKENFLKLNEVKTEIILFGSKKRRGSPLVAPENTDSCYQKSGRIRFNKVYYRKEK